MSNIIKFVVIIFVLSFHEIFARSVKNQDELLSAVVVFRHGHKFPKKYYFDVYPNYPFKEPSQWPGDFGSLTNKGKTLSYNLGKWLRQRYEKILPENYSNKDIYIRSTDYDRTIMTAQGALAGLYPPKGADIWIKNLLWQPIPVHVLPQDQDIELSQISKCPKFNQLRHEVFSGDKGKQAEILDDVKYLSAYTGKNITTLEEVEALNSIFNVIEENNYPLEDWAKEALPLLKEKSDIYCRSFALNLEMQRFKSGPFYHMLISHFDAVLSNDKDKQKFLLFSGHKRTINNVLNALGANSSCAPYGAMVIFELRKKLQDVYVNIQYKTTQKEPEDILQNERYSDFKQAVSVLSVEPSEWRRECML